MISPASEPVVTNLMSLRVALCQVETQPWETGENLARTLSALREAAAGGAELAITPECVLNGYPEHHGAENRARFGQSCHRLDGPEVGAMREIALSGRMAIIVGIAEITLEGRLHNSAVVISSRGEIDAVYRKVHCRDFEDATRDGLFVPGDEFLARDFPTHNGSARVGVMICFDREIPETVRCLRALGSQFIACPLATNTGSLRDPIARVDNELVTRVRAAENEVYIGVVNHAGRFNGGSFIVGPLGEVVVQLDEKPQVHFAEIPVGSIAETFHANPLGWMGWGFRRPEVYDRFLRGRS